MICLQDRNGAQCGSPAHFDLFDPIADPDPSERDARWFTRTCRLHLASVVWDRSPGSVLVVPRHQPPPVVVPVGMTPTKRLKRTLRRRASRRAP